MGCWIGKVILSVIRMLFVWECMYEIGYKFMFVNFFNDNRGGFK